MSAALGHAVWWLGYQVESSGARPGRGSSGEDDMPPARLSVGAKNRRSAAREEDEGR